MSFFQHSVLTKHLKNQDKQKISEAYTKFKSHFFNPEIQENIRNAKEEQYQGEFLIDLFVNVLGYTKYPTPNFNLTTEYKNVKDSKKADGAIIIHDVVKAVIELKGTNTTDLGKIETQAFGYKNNQPDCVYVITSNFEKLRFYIDNAIDHYEFNLFTLSESDFELLYLCLAFENIEKGLPKKLKDESLSQEDVITKQLYSDYSLFKRKLHQNLVELNPEFEPLELFKKSQKLLDRFLFLFFAEDRQLLPPNSVKMILQQWVQLRELDENIPLYDRFKKYFGYLNTGFKGKQYDVFAYNGGLFKPDEILDSVKIDDELLYEHTLKLSEYDFDSEVDVNILGHIFENSLNELDEIKVQLDGTEIDKTKTKRKKDGVFYTPKYITKYIVDNTIGKLCSEKKEEFKIIEDDFITDRKRNSNTKRTLLEKLSNYRTWLLQLTIVDPACGSGAFLNQALDFLINEHRYIDELQAKLFGDAMVLTDMENSILENNLFGVDINEESVEIAKLSLWLRTAQPNRKLNDLSNNIKCGNSLIDDHEVAGEKAFNWQLEFPQIFNKGGFDCIIGNPPYGAKFNEKEKGFIQKEYNSYLYKFESYIYFIELATRLTSKDGYFGFITPELWMSLENCFPIRKILYEKNGLKEIFVCGENVFQDAVINSIIFIYQMNYKQEYINIINGKSQFHLQYINWFKNTNLSVNYRITLEEGLIIEKIISNSKNLSDFSDIIQGITPYDKYRGQSEETIKNRAFHFSFKKDESCEKWLGGNDLQRYIITWSNEWLSYGNWLAAPREKRFFSGNRLLFREIPGANKRIQACYVADEIYYHGHSVTPLKLKEFSNISLLYILALVNSNLLSWYGKMKLPNFGKDIFPKLNPNDIKLLPIKDISSGEQQPFILKTGLIISKIKDLQEIRNKFQRSIQRKFSLEELSNKLQDWHLLSYPDFIKELAKKRVKLSLSEEAEWEDYFIQESKKALEIKHQIETTDKEIDRMVYELYELTEEEIGIVENK